MPSKPQLLGMVGHGTTGSDGIQRGIHLRWQFAPEMGFPMSAFHLYRRSSQDGPAPVCFDFGKSPLGPAARQLVLRAADKQLVLDGLAAAKVGERSRLKPPYSMADSAHFPAGVTPLSTKFRVLDVGRAPVRITLPALAHEVVVHLELEKDGALHCRASDGNEIVALGQTEADQATVRSISLTAARIEYLQLSGKRCSIVKICFRMVEDCASQEAWKRIAGPVCLPVFYPKGPCKGHAGPDCDEVEISKRLPEDPCERHRFQGEAVRGLAEALRVVVDADGELPQSERLLPGEVEHDDCPPPGQSVPALEIPAVDTLLMAALDPAIARILGLYYVDDPGAGSYDYKCTGEWPVGSLWRLAETKTFDTVKLGRRLLNWISFEPLVIQSRTRPSIVVRPNRRLRTKRALAFFSIDDRDWNLPGPRPEPAEAVRIHFQDPVGEVQVYVGQDITHVEMRAFDVEGNPVSEKIRASQRNTCLALHAEAPDAKIGSVLLSGDRFWIYRISWGPNRIPFGLQCAFAYDLSIAERPRPPAPGDVEADSLPGVTVKAADCEPLLSGGTVDARCNAGLRWSVTEDLFAAPGDVAVRYDVMRLAGADEQTLLTADGAVLAALQQGAEPYVPSDGWPPHPPYFIDRALAPGTYRYQVASIDIFGRRSDWSEPPAAANLAPPPPPTPSITSAKWLERGDARLEAAERAILESAPAGAIHIKWSWPLEAERTAPDASHFRVHYTLGAPNVLDARVAGVAEAGGLGTLTVRFSGIGDVAANVFAGRQITQGRRTFRILSSGAAVAAGETTAVSATVRLAPSPSQSHPMVADCSIALDATIPVQVKSFVVQGQEATATLRTVALGAAPASGLVGSELQIQGEVLALAEVVGAPAFSANASEWAAKFTIPSDADLEQLLELTLPAFVALRLPRPSPILYRDFSAAGNWPSYFDEVLPRSMAGAFELVIRAVARPGEVAGLTQPAPGRYLLLVASLPAGFVVSKSDRRKRLTLGLSCVGADGSESEVCAPVTITRIYGASTAELSAAATLPPEAAPPAGHHVYASSPDYRGKSTFLFSWASQSGYTYQVYRALDETLFAFDAQLRSSSVAIGANGRFPDEAAVTGFLASYPAGLRAMIRTQVIEPTELNRASLESSEYVDTLLQALASLPLNERAFTRLSLSAEQLGPDPTQANHFRCVDSTIEGKARGRYFYRIRAIDPLAKIGPLSSSTFPVWTRDISPPARPSLCAVLGGDRSIELTWRGGARASRFDVYRTSAQSNTRDLRLMGDPVVSMTASVPVAAGGSAELGIQLPGATAIHAYGAAAAQAAANSILSAPPGPDLLQTEVDMSGGFVAGLTAADGTALVIVYRDAAGALQHTPIPGRVYRWVDADLDPGAQYWYAIVAVRTSSANGTAFTTRSTAALGSGRAFDLSTPTAPALDSLQWRKVEPDGTEHPYADAVAIATSAVRVAWSGVPDDDEVLVERVGANQVVWSAVSGWMQAAATYRDDAPDASTTYRYRLRVRRANGKSAVGPSSQIAGN